MYLNVLKSNVIYHISRISMGFDTRVVWSIPSPKGVIQSRCHALWANLV